jgi:hypothetical protein
MEIIRAIWRSLIRMLILNAILVPFMVLGPVVFFVLPLALIYHNPDASYTWLAELFVFTAPLSCAFYMLVSTHWHSVRQWQREGRDLRVMGSKWREAHGGIVRTCWKSIKYMVGGLFASYFFEILFLIAFKYCRSNGSTARLARYALWFVLFPFACFAPVILLWLVRWRRGRRNQLWAHSLHEELAREIAH